MNEQDLYKGPGPYVFDRGVFRTATIEDDLTCYACFAQFRTVEDHTMHSMTCQGWHVGQEIVTEYGPNITVTRKRGSYARAVL